MRQQPYAGACVSLRTNCMVGLVRRRSIDAAGTSLFCNYVGDLRNPQPETTSGTLPLGRYIPMHPRRLCT